MATVKKDINEESDQIKAVRKIVKKKAASLDDDKVIIPTPISDGPSWKELDFSHPEKCVRIGTLFSGIGAIEHAFQRLHLNHKIIFAGDIEPKCKTSYFANYEINDEDWFTDVRDFDAKKYKRKVDFLIGGAPCQAFSMVGHRQDLKMRGEHCFMSLLV